MGCLGVEQQLTELERILQLQEEGVNPEVIAFAFGRAATQLSDEYVERSMINIELRRCATQEEELAVRLRWMRQLIWEGLTAKAVSKRLGIMVANYPEIWAFYNRVLNGRRSLEGVSKNRERCWQKYAETGDSKWLAFEKTVQAMEQLLEDCGSV